MDLADFEGRFTVGYGLSIEEKSALEDEMRRRVIEERLASVKFWGRIAGTTGDYLIVCGLVSVLDEPHRKFYFATNKNLVLQQLPDLTDDFRKQAAALSGRFVGNPSKLENGEEAPEEEAEEGEAEDNGEEATVKKSKKILFSEAHRLSYVVSQIESDCALVPKGAFVVTSTHHVVADPLFIGLSGTEAGTLDAYLHFRAAQHPSRRRALKSAAVLGTGDFMDPASEDEPKGVVWSIRVDAAKGQVNIRSFKWPGYFFWHQIASPYFGAAYFGDGSMNKDLGFMA